MSLISNLFNNEAFVQSLGFIGIFAGIVSFHMTKRSGILIFQIVCCSFFAIQLTILEAYSGAIINFIGIGRGIIYSMRGKYKWADCRFVPYCMITLFVSTGIVTAFIEGPLGLLPAGAMIVQSIAQFSSVERRIRIISLFASPLWIIYHVAVGSLGGWIGEMFMLLSISLSLIKPQRGDTGTTECEK